MPSDGPSSRPSTSYHSAHTGLNLAGTSTLFDPPSSPFSRLSSPSGSRTGSRRSSSSQISAERPNEPVTTFIPHRLTIDADETFDDDDSSIDEVDGDDPFDSDALESDVSRGRAAALNKTKNVWKKSRRRRTAIKVLKDGEGRDSLLHLAHSLVLLLHSSLHFPPPRTYTESILAPGGFILTRLFPRSMRAHTMQRIYTAAEGLENVRRIFLLARWIQAGTEAAMDRMAARSKLSSTSASLQSNKGALSSAAEEEKVTAADEKEEGFGWLRPLSVAPLDAGTVENEVVEQGRQPSSPSSRSPSGEESPTRSHLNAVSTWRETWEMRLATVCDTLSVLGEACDVAAFMAGSGIFWRAVGFAELGLLSRRRRRGIERVGVLLSLCSVLLSLALLKMQRLRLRAELRSAHRRIIQANDRIGWASELSGKRIPTGAAISYRKSLSNLVEEREKHEQNENANTTTATTIPPAPPLPATDEVTSLSAPPHLRPYGPGIQEALEDLDDARSSTSSHSTSDPQSLSSTSLLETTERDLLQAETDLARTRHSLVWTFWDRIAFVADGVFLAFEAVRPDTDKEGVEAWSGILADGIRLFKVWDGAKWGSG